MEDSDDDEFDDLDEDEVSLGSMDEDFGGDLDEEGGTFMDVSDDDNRPGNKKLIHTKTLPPIKIGYLLKTLILNAASYFFSLQSTFKAPSDNQHCRSCLENKFLEKSRCAMRRMCHIRHLLRHEIKFFKR